MVLFIILLSLCLISLIFKCGIEPFYISFEPGFRKFHILTFYPENGFSYSLFSVDAFDYYQTKIDFELNILWFIKKNFSIKKKQRRLK